MTIPDHVPAHLVRDFDPYRDPAFAVDPFRAHDRFHGDPILWTEADGGYWVLTRSADIRVALRDTANLSNVSSPILDGRGAWPRPLIPEELDPPEHGKYRSLFVRHLRPRSADPIREAVRATCAERISQFAPTGHCDLVEDLAKPIQYALFAALYDVPFEAAQRCAGWTHILLHSRDRTARADAGRHLAAFLSELIADRPEHGLIGTLCASQVDGRPLTDEEVLDMAVMMALASLDTVASSLSFSFKHLAEHPEDQAALAADPAITADAVDELLRLHSVAVLMRTAVRDVELCGVQIRKGDRVALSLALANRDPDVYPDPAIGRWDRPNRGQHVAFGSGAHRCVGAELARAALETAITQFHQHIPSYRVQPDAEIAIDGGALATINTLPLEWCPGQEAQP